MISIVSILDHEYSSSMSENLVTEPSSPSVNGRPRMLEKPADYPNIVVAGGSKEFKEHIKSLGGKWVAKERGYVLPASQREHVKSLVDAAKSSHAEEVAVEPTAEIAGHTTEPSSSSSAPMVTDEPVGTMEGAVSSADGAGDGGGEPASEMDVAGVEPGPVVEPKTASEPAHEAEPVVTEPSSAETVVAAEASTSAAPYSNLSMVVLNTRSIGVIGEPTPALSAEFNQMGGKFSKTLKIGDDKHAGWSFHKNQLAQLQTLLPGTPLTPAPAPSPIGTRSPTERKKTASAMTGDSSKANTPVSSPNNKNNGDKGESGDKRKRKRTAKAEEAEQPQTHALASAPTTTTAATSSETATPAQVEV
jgi:hypothetical protein